MAGEENRVTIVIDGENDAGGAFAAATAEAKALGAAVEDSGKQADSSSGLFSRLANVIGSLFSGFAGGGGVGAGAAFANFFSTPAGIVTIIAALASGAAGIIPAVVAAGGALAAFGALAYPIFSKVTAGFTAITGAANKTARDQAWDAIPKAMRPLETGLLGLNKTWDAMSAKLAPDVFKIFNTGLQIANKLLPMMLPFAKAAAGAIDQLLKGFDKFASSPGFKQFAAQMLALAGPAINTIGFGLGRITIAVGRLLEAMANPNGLRILKGLLDGIAMFITGIAIAFQKATPWVERFYHDFATGFDAVRRVVATVAPEIYRTMVTWFGNAYQWVMARLKPFRDFWAQHWREIDLVTRTAWTNIVNIIKTAWSVIEPLLKVGLGVLKALWQVTWIAIKVTTVTIWDVIKATVVSGVHIILDVIGAALALLTGHWHQAWSDLVNAASAALHGVVSMVTSILSGLVSILYQAGRNIIQGFVNGILSMAGAVGSAIGSVVSWVTGHLPGSPAKMGPLSGAGAPFARGQRLGGDFAAGMRSQTRMVADAAGALAGAAGPGGSRGGVAGGGGRMALEVVPGGSALFEKFMAEFIRRYVRVRGGNVQAVFGRQ